MDKPAAPSHHLGQPRVLIVDDDRDAVAMLSTILELENYDVRSANDGAEGLETAQRFRPQLVLMDLDMPVMDGVAAAAVLRADRRRTVLVALSARCGRGTDPSKREAGFDMQIGKPFDTEKLLEALRGFLVRPAGHSEPH